MDNQQPSTYLLLKLALNAKFGDGNLWRHPECVNSKCIWTSTTPELLQVKYDLCPSIFTTGVKPATVGQEKGRFENAKPMFRLASNVHPIFTKVHEQSKESLLSQLTIFDWALLYLDNGSCVIRRDYHTMNSFRFSIAIGDCANTSQRKELVENHLRNLFGSKFGRVVKNNSKATENNKSWVMTKPVAEVILAEARSFEILKHKFPEGKGSTTIPKGSRVTGLSHSKRGPRK